MPNEYEVVLPGPQGRPIKLRIPDSEMRVCMQCGHEFFCEVFRVAWIKQAAILNAPLVCVRAPVMVCDQCRAELTPEAPTKREAAGISGHA